LQIQLGFNRNVIFILLAIRKWKRLENSQDFFVKTKTKTLGLKTKTKTKTLLFVLEASRDQDFGLEDYITGNVHMQHFTYSQTE